MTTAERAHTQREYSLSFRVGHVLFDREEDRDKFITLFDDEEVARILSGDWNKYTDTPPEVRVSRWTCDDDMQSIVDRFNRGAL